MDQGFAMVLGFHQILKFCVLKFESFEAGEMVLFDGLDFLKIVGFQFGSDGIQFLLFISFDVQKLIPEFLFFFFESNDIILSF